MPKGPETMPKGSRVHPPLEGTSLPNKSTRLQCAERENSCLSRVVHVCIQVRIATSTGGQLYPRTALGIDRTGRKALKMPRKTQALPAQQRSIASFFNISEPKQPALLSELKAKNEIKLMDESQTEPTAAP